MEIMTHAFLSLSYSLCIKFLYSLRATQLFVIWIWFWNQRLIHLICVAMYGQCIYIDTQQQYQIKKSKSIEKKIYWVVDVPTPLVDWCKHTECVWKARLSFLVAMNLSTPTVRVSNLTPKHIWENSRSADVFFCSFSSHLYFTSVSAKNFQLIGIKLISI